VRGERREKREGMKREGMKREEALREHHKGARAIYCTLSRTGLAKVLGLVLSRGSRVG
jgi:hypothetical protein